MVSLCMLTNFNPRIIFQIDLEKLKSDASLTLNEAFFSQLADAANDNEGRAAAFLQVFLVQMLLILTA